jgi:drug/metabolite transporter (DMT)-like permease
LFIDMKMQTGAVLRTLKTLLALAAIAFALGAFFFAFQAVAQGVSPSPVDVSPSQAASDALLQTMDVSEQSTVVVQVTEMDRATAAMVTLPTVIVCALVAAILSLLAALLREADAGRPFTPDNVKRLRRIARLTLLAAVVGWWLGPALQAVAQARLDSSQIAVNASLTPVLVALGAYALVSIWQRGAELADFEEHAI